MKSVISDALSDSIRGFRLPRYHEIPNMGLYLEQATKYINQCIQPLGVEELTPSMVRNYVKQGLIPAPIKKQYYADHIGHLISVALLKLSIPLEHIKTLFFLLSVGNRYTIQRSYDYFCDELENVLYFRFGLKDTVDHFGTTNSMAKEMLRSAIVAVSQIVYLDSCFHLLSDSNNAAAQPQTQEDTI